MRTSETSGKLWTALAKAQAELEDPPTKGKGHHGKYARLVDGLPKARKVLAKHGIALVQFVNVDEHGASLVTRLAMADEWVEGDYPLLLNEKNPQQQGANMTYARRYAAWAMLGLAPEDDDAQASADNQESNTRGRRNKETSSEKERRQGKHDTSFTASERKRFNGELGAMGWKYEDVAAWCAEHNRPRPSGMTQEQRGKLLAWLADEGAAVMLEWVESRGGTNG